MCAAYSHQRWMGGHFRRVGVIPALLRRAAATFGVAIGLAALGLGGQSLQASDLGATTRPARIAAVTANPTASSLRRGARGSAASGSDPLLAQSTPAAAANPQQAEVLAVIALTAPESIDEEVAKEHGLQLLERNELPSLGLRMVRYRVRNARPLAVVIAALQADRRVSRAQANVRYTLPEENAPATEVSSAKERQGGDAGPQGQPSSQRRSAAAPTARKKPSAEPANFAGAAAAPVADKGPALRHKRSLASSGQTALRWPTADEPFVNVGATSR